MLAVRGRVLPSTLHDVQLSADVRLPHAVGDVRVQGESLIPKSNGKVRRVWLEPNNPPAFPQAIQAILAADLIVIGPGSLYTSILPNLLVPDIAEAIRASRALKLFVCNVATERGETNGYTVGDHIHAIEEHVMPGLFDISVANSNESEKLPNGVDWVEVDEDLGGSYRLYQSDLVDMLYPWRHDSNKLARVVLDLFQERTGPLVESSLNAKKNQKSSISKRRIKMTVKVGINGFGRIGRQVLKAIRDFHPDELEVVAFNDIGDLKTMAHLLKYDSNYGHFDGTVEVKDDGLMVDGKPVKAFKETDPAAIPWGDLGIEIVIESTGIFTVKSDGVNKKGKTVKGAENHITKGGAKKVIISAPAEGEDLTVVLGVNDEMYDPAKHHVVSNASCTTNGLAPAVKVVYDKYGIVRGFMTTIHAYTNDQKILDLPHSDLRRARAAAMNIIPTTTGAAKAIKLVIPGLAGKMDGYSLRVPTSTVSIIDLTVEFEKPTTTEQLRQDFRDAAAGRLKGILGAADEPLVSIDYKGDPRSSIVDLPFTSVLGKESGTFAKIVAWYDNEWGYSVRTGDLAALMAKSL